MNRVQSEVTSEVIDKVFAIFPDCEFRVKQKLFMGRRKDNFVQSDDDLEYTIILRRSDKIYTSKAQFPVALADIVSGKSLPDIAKQLIFGIEQEMLKDKHRLQVTHSKKITE